MKKTILTTAITFLMSSAFAQNELRPLSLFCQDGSLSDSVFNLKIDNIKVNKVDTEHLIYQPDVCRATVVSNGEVIYSCAELAVVPFIKAANVTRQKIEYIGGKAAGPYEDYRATYQVTGGEIVGQVGSNSSGRPVVKYFGSIEFNPKSARCKRGQGALCRESHLGLKEFKPVRLTFNGITDEAMVEFEFGSMIVNCTMEDSLR
jgi:hypothetical protein